MGENVLVLSDTPDNVDYPKLRDAARLATETGCSVVVHNVCHECPSVTTVPPTSSGQVSGRATSSSNTRTGARSWPSIKAVS
jgi:hypothetical protein